MTEAGRVADFLCVPTCPHAEHEQQAGMPPAPAVPRSENRLVCQDPVASMWVSLPRVQGS